MSSIELDLTSRYMGVSGIADGAQIKRIERIQSVNELIEIFQHREDKYRKRYIHVEMLDVFNHRKSMQKYKVDDFHNEFFHDSYCDCLYCARKPMYDFLPFVYLKSYKLKMLYFEVLKAFRRRSNRFIHDSEKLYDRNKSNATWKAHVNQTKAQTNWMLEMSDTEFFDALRRLGDFSQVTVDQWISDERVTHEAKTD